MQVVFRADAAANIGYGHVMRCLTLANALARLGARIHFICREHPHHPAKLIERHGHTVSLLPLKMPPGDVVEDYRAWVGAAPLVDAEETREAIAHRFGKADLLVVDHYGLDQEWEQPLRGHCGSLLVIDDLADRRHDCELLLDQTFNRQRADYQGLTPPHCKLLLGVRYLLLRPEFQRLTAAAAHKRERLERVNHLLVSLGATDSHNVTATVLDGLARLPRAQRPRITVVLSSHAPHLDPIQRQLERFESEISLAVDVTAMADLLLDADLAIGASGTSTWERCALGLPTLTVIAAANQRHVADAMAQTGAIESLGEWQALTPEQICQHVSQLRRSPSTLRRMSRAAMQLVDGDGTMQVIRALLKRLDARVTLRPVREDDSEQIHAWQRQAGMRRYFRQPAIPDQAQHQSWFREWNRERDPGYIIGFSGLSAGLLRLNRINDNHRPCYEISILLSAEFRSLGIAARALAQLIDTSEHCTLIAEVHRDNSASHRLFQRCGFKRIDIEKYQKKVE